MPEIGKIYVFDSAVILARNLEIEHTPRTRSLDEGCFYFYDEDLREAIEAEKTKYVPGSGQFDGTLLCLERFSIENGKRKLRLCDIMYSTYQTLKARLDRENGQEHTLTRTVSMIGIAETSDGSFPLGHRSGRHMPNRYLSPAGFTDHEGMIDNWFLPNLTKEEIGEETGVEIDPEDVTYVGLTSGDDSRNNTVILHSGLDCDSEKTEAMFKGVNAELRQNGAKIEHDHLIYLPSDLTSVREFLCGRFTGCLNRFRDIYFEDGVCVRGPDLIKGEKYRQIGNGISAILSLMKGRVSNSDYWKLVEDVKESGIVEDIEHLDINEKLGLEV
jgi:hypothetical protein